LGEKTNIGFVLIWEQNSIPKYILINEQLILLINGAIPISYENALYKNAPGLIIENRVY